MPIDKIFGTSIDVLSKSIDLRSKNHNLISANLANAETPNYVPTALSFESELRDALKGRTGEKGAARTGTPNKRHIPLKGQADSLAEVKGSVVQTPASTIGRDGNAVELEQEMGKLASNQIMYNASVQLLNKNIERLKMAIKGQ